MRNMPQASVLVVMLLVLSGCGVVLYEGMLAGLNQSKKSEMLAEERISEIEKGKTTRGEIEQKFGKPDSRITQDGYESTWIYNRAGIPSWIPGIRNAKAQSLTIQFGPEGIVQEYRFTTHDLKSL